MGESFFERFKVWICQKIGHKFDKSKEWEYNNQTHKVCVRCNRIISKNFNKG